jgi:hypothetical protein
MQMEARAPDATDASLTVAFGATAWDRDSALASLNEAVKDALQKSPAGLALRRLDPHVLWATSRGLSEWAHALAAADNRLCVESRADLLRLLPAVGAVDRIAGLSVVYPATTVERLRQHTAAATAVYSLCASTVRSISTAPPSRGGRPRPVVVIDSVDACRAAVADIRRRGALVALDCEGTSIVRRQPTSPGVALLQMTARGGPCYLFDMCRTEPSRSGKALMRRGGLGALLADESITKVVHDRHQDTRALAAAYGCILAGTFDTQEMHMRAEGNVDGPRPGLNALLAFYGLGTNQHKDTMRAVYPIDLWCWHRRPLPAWMVEYAVRDVDRLLDLHDAIVARLVSSIAVSSTAPQWTVVVMSAKSPSSRPVSVVTVPKAKRRAASTAGRGQPTKSAAIADESGAGRRRRRHAPAVARTGLLLQGL